MDKDIAKAKTNFISVNVSDLKMNVRREDKIIEGYCNNCTDKDGYRKINVIELRNISFRLCDKCKKMLKKML